MKVTAIELTNIKSFKALEKTEFSDTINVFVGPNNAGKSTILKSIYKLQNNGIIYNNHTIGTTESIIKLHIKGTHLGLISSTNTMVEFQMGKAPNNILRTANGHSNYKFAPGAEPGNIIYPYLSKRKTVSFDPTINEGNANSVAGNFTHLYSKIDRLINPYFSAHQEYVDACKGILGFVVSTNVTANGKEAVLYVDGRENISLLQMGEGVTNIIGLISDLCMAQDRIFLIEELENDIHPQALKALLDLISKKCSSNQFFISTHSNIVMKHLGASEDSKVFRVANELTDESKPNLKYSTLQLVPNNPVDRIKVLEELGYDAFDFDFWKAWLFLEESSAERLIRDFFIPWYTPDLRGKLRTFSANSVNNVKLKFDDFNKLFVFLHLEPAYKNKVWVYIDSGEEESRIINEMKEIYGKSGWNSENFSQFSEHDFEKYYPSKFQSNVKEVLKIEDKQKKRQAKRDLLLEVLKWAKTNEKEAKVEFESSASEIIEVLKTIDQKI